MFLPKSRETLIYGREFWSLANSRVWQVTVGKKTRRPLTEEVKDSRPSHVVDGSRNLRKNSKFWNDFEEKSQRQVPRQSGSNERNLPHQEIPRNYQILEQIVN